MPVGPHTPFSRVWQPTIAPKGAVGIVHGLGEHSGRYVQLAGRLRDQGYRVVALDQRGHGKNGGQPGVVSNYDLLLDDVDWLLNELRRDEFSGPVYLYGQSLGGNVVINYALRRPAKLDGVVISSPLLLPTSRPPLWKLAAARLLRYVWPDVRLRTGLPAEGLSHDAQVVSAYIADPLVHDFVSARFAVQMMEAGRWALAHAEQVANPVLLMHGTDDPITSWEASSQFADRAGDFCQFRKWSGLRHELQWEREVLDCVLAWLRETSEVRLATRREGD